MLIDYIHRINIFQIGVGGTGSWLVYPLCKFLNNIYQRFANQGLLINYILVDDDIVEERNILRQNFESYDVGRSKVQSTIRKYCGVFPLTGFRYRPTTKPKFEKLFYGSMTAAINPRYSVTFVFGCVDDNKARRGLFNYFKKHGTGYPIVYFDSGNDLYHGQIVTTAFDIFDKEIEFSYFKNGRKFNQPKFLSMFPVKVQEGETEESCAFFGDQSQGINIQAANLLFLNFQQAIIHRQLPPPVINFNSAGFSTFQL